MRVTRVRQWLGRLVGLVAVTGAFFIGGVLGAPTVGLAQETTVAAITTCGEGGGSSSADATAVGRLP